MAPANGSAVVELKESSTNPTTVLRLGNKLLTHFPSKELKKDDPLTIKELHLERNKLLDLPEDVAHFLNLEVLNLSYNPLTDFPEPICSLMYLEELRLVDCGLQNLPESVSCLTNLKSLFLDVNGFSELPSCVEYLESLELLSLGRNLFTEFVGNLPRSLRHLNIDNNHLKEFPWCCLQLRKLVKLNLNHNVINSLPTEIADISSLEELYLNSNRISTLPSNLCKMSQLRVLELNNNKLTVLPSDMRGLVALEEISLLNNPILQPPSYICNSGISQIIAYQDCLRAQLYEPCRRCLNVFILGSSRSGKRDLFSFLTNQPKDKLDHGEAISRARNEFTNISLTVYKCSGKQRYNILHQLFFQKLSVYIICVNIDKYHSSGFKFVVRDWLELIHVAVPEAIVYVLPTCASKGGSKLSRASRVGKAKSIVKSLKSWQRGTLNMIQSRIDELEDAANLAADSGPAIATQAVQTSKAKKLTRMTSFTDEVVDAAATEYVSRLGLSLKRSSLMILRNSRLRILNNEEDDVFFWKTGKSGQSRRHYEPLLDMLECLTHDTRYFPSLADEMRCSWRNLERLVVVNRRSQRSLSVDRSSLREPAIQVGVDPAQIDEAIDYLRLNGTLLVFERIPHLSHHIFHTPQELISLVNAVLQHDLFRKNNPALADLSPFQLESEKRSLESQGVMSLELLQQLVKTNVPQDPHILHVVNTLRKLALARQVDSVGAASASVSSNESGSSSSLSPEPSRHRMGSTAGARRARFYRIPWYIKREGSTQCEPNQAPPNVKCLWPNYLNIDTHQLQVNCVFYNGQVNSLFDRFSICVHHCLDYREDWAGGVLATVDDVPLLIHTTSTDHWPSIALSTRGASQSTLAPATTQPMWAVMLQIVECLVTLLNEYPGLHYEMFVLCPHCLKRSATTNSAAPAPAVHKFPWELVYSLEGPDLAPVSCPHLKRHELLHKSLVIPPMMELNQSLSPLYDLILPHVHRSNWRSFGRCLGLSDLYIDFVRDTTSSFDFNYQKLALLVLWKRLLMEKATIDALLAACDSADLPSSLMSSLLAAARNRGVARMPSVLRPSSVDHSFTMAEDVPSGDAPDGAVVQRRPTSGRAALAHRAPHIAQVIEESIDETDESTSDLSSQLSDLSYDSRRFSEPPPVVGTDKKNAAGYDERYSLCLGTLRLGPSRSSTLASRDQTIKDLGDLACSPEELEEDDADDDGGGGKSHLYGDGDKASENMLKQEADDVNVGSHSDEGETADPIACSCGAQSLDELADDLVGLCVSSGIQEYEAEMDGLASDLVRSCVSAGIDEYQSQMQGRHCSRRSEHGEDTSTEDDGGNLLERSTSEQVLNHSSASELDDSKWPSASCIS